jgi:hypothetical protein
VDDFTVFKAGRVLEQYGQEILDALPPDLDTPLTHVHSNGARQVIITVRTHRALPMALAVPPLDPAEWRPTPCEADVLRVIGEADRPLTTSGVLQALARAGLDHGESTVKQALSRLVKSHRLCNEGRGYHPPRSNPVDFT